ncbi:Uncharacterised protein [Mycobacteroides abscessus subsp. abscessus]|uniref:hypothetical protein n=1 Tax=Mycobacteroides abscessus TaxID=36809 RepID=UPI00092C107C|nr:hypothetical protein [Mycobacteroides abscessus]SIC64755.1 Uncharacterised protein [Mycobacteroides abscessus subsp. abscessus]SIG65726.1 Uncharacterised protein [Mycobacteroides abscessus subsp. abscessus]
MNENLCTSAEVAERWKGVLRAVVTPAVGDHAARFDYRHHAPVVSGRRVPRRVFAVAQALWETVNEEAGVSPTPGDWHHLHAYTQVFGKSDAGKLSVSTLQKRFGGYVTLVGDSLQREWVLRAIGDVSREATKVPVQKAVKCFVQDHPQAPKVLVDRLTAALRASARCSLTEGWQDDVHFVAGTLPHRVCDAPFERRSRPYPNLVGWNPQPVLERFAAHLPEPVCSPEQQAAWVCHVTAALEKFVADHGAEVWVACVGYCGHAAQDARRERARDAFTEVCDGLKAHINRPDTHTKVNVYNCVGEQPRIHWQLTRDHDTEVTGSWEEVVAEVTVQASQVGCADCSESLTD